MLLMLLLLLVLTSLLQHLLPMPQYIKAREHWQPWWPAPTEQWEASAMQRITPIVRLFTLACVSKVHIT